SSSLALCRHTPKHRLNQILLQLGSTYQHLSPQSPLPLLVELPYLLTRPKARPLLPMTRSLSLLLGLPTMAYLRPSPNPLLSPLQLAHFSVSQKGSFKSLNLTL